MPIQLTLPISIRDDATFENFYAGSNHNLLTILQRFLAKKTEFYLYLWGHTGVGCSHLLQACCHAVQQQNLTAAYIPLAEVINLSPHILENLETLDLICIDDLQFVAGKADWEEALFHLFNRVQAKQNCFLIAANNVPEELNLILRDLDSRLKSGLIFQVQELTDEQKINALQMRAKLRGLELADEVAIFLLHRSPRNLNNLFQFLEQLDNASLTAQRKLTIPFVKSVLNL